MATFFGEILPNISRAVDEDDDEDDSRFVPCTYVADWTAAGQAEVTSGKLLQCDRLIVAAGPTAVGFCDAYLVEESSSLLGHIGSTPSDTDEDIKPTAGKECSLYRLKATPGVIVCVCRGNVLAEQTFGFVTELFSHIATSDSLSVVALSSAPACEFKSEQCNLRVPFLRCLTTSQFREVPACPFLEQPNTMAGLPAQVLSHCQVRGLRCVLYMCYNETMFLDAESLHTLEKILPSSPLKLQTKSKSEVKEKIKKLIESNARDNHLYI